MSGNPFDTNKWIRDALARAAKERQQAPEPEKPFDPEPKELPAGWYFDYLGRAGMKPPPEEKPEAEHWADQFLKGVSSGSPLAPAELPGETRAAIAQMYSQFQEFQTAGFSRDEAWELIKIGFATVCAIQAKHHLDGS